MKNAKLKMPPLPINIGKERKLTDIDGKKQHFIVRDEIVLSQSAYPRKAIYLQRIEFKNDKRIQLRLGYYMIGRKPRMAGKWVWGQYATMIPAVDFRDIISEASERGWI